MNPSDWSLRARQIFGILIPGAVWVFTVLLLLHIPAPPVRLITGTTPSVVEAAVFIGTSYFVGFALRKLSWRFSVWASAHGAALLPRFFNDPAMQQRAEDLQSRVAEVIKNRYSHSADFRLPVGDRIFGFCKRVLREASPKLYDHLDTYEDEINLLNLVPLPLLIFGCGWVSTWYASGQGVWNRYALPLGLAAILAAFFCLAQYLPLKWAEHKETFESFVAFHLESGAISKEKP